MAQKRVLFVCVENSNRSQMAQAVDLIHGGPAVQALSAGSRPFGIVNPKAIAAMQALDYDLSRHESKSLTDLPPGAYDFVATMGCGDSCPEIATKQREEWAIPDPEHMEPAEFNKVRDLIGEKVRHMLSALGRDT